MSFLASCTQLQFLRLQCYNLSGPGSLLASTMLQHLQLHYCDIAAADGAADPVSWQQVFAGPGRLPHLTSLQLFDEEPALRQADFKAAVACCSNLKVLGYDILPSSFVPALARLPGLTNLQLRSASDEECRSMAQLTGLRQLAVTFPWQLSAVGLRQLAALQQLTSLGLGGFSCSQLDTLARHLMRDKPEGQGLSDCVYGIVNKVCESCHFNGVCAVWFKLWRWWWWGGGEGGAEHVMNDNLSPFLHALVSKVGGKACGVVVFVEGEGGVNGCQVLPLNLAGSLEDKCNSNKSVGGRPQRFQSCMM